MSFNKKDRRPRRFSFNHVDKDVHTSTHAKTAMYALQHHEEYEHKTLPINPNSLEFTKTINDQLVSSLYLDRDSFSPSNEFKQNLTFFYIYLTLYLLTYLSFALLLNSKDMLSAHHLQIHLICLIFLLVLSYTILFMVLKNCLILRSRQLFLVLSHFLYMYLILTDARVLFRFTGEAYTENPFPLVLGLITLSPMLRMVLFDHYFYLFISNIIALILYITVQLALSPVPLYTSGSELALVTLFTLLQVIDCHRSDIRIRHLFWRREKEIMVSKEPTVGGKAKTFGINSDVEVIMDACDQIKQKLKYVNQIVLYKEVKDIIKENILEVERIKWRIAHRQDIKVIIDPNLDDEERQYIEQNCLEIKHFKAEDYVPTVSVTEVNELRPPGFRYSLNEVENVLTGFGNTWNFDIWFIHTSTGESISIVGKYLFSKYGVNTACLISKEVTDTYFAALEHVSAT